MLSGLAILVIGGLFYGTAEYGWMVLVGRLCHGIHFGVQSTLLRIYIGETSNTVRDMLKEDPEKSQLKNTNFLIGFILGTVGFAYGPGECCASCVCFLVIHIQNPSPCCTHELST